MPEGAAGAAVEAANPDLQQMTKVLEMALHRTAISQYRTSNDVKRSDKDGRHFFITPDVHDTIFSFVSDTRSGNSVYIRAGDGTRTG